MLAGLVALAWGTAQAVTCQNNLPPSNPDFVYGNNGDGTVTDLRNGLMWKKCVEGESGTGCSGTATTLAWAAAQVAAQASTFAGYSDWRVPNIRELQSLVEDCRANPAINDAVFPNDPSSDVWSGSPYVDGPGLAYEVVFDGGYSGGDSRAAGYHVRLVRGGQSFGDLIFRNGFDSGG
jgi:hypothetical protein